MMKKTTKLLNSTGSKILKQKFGNKRLFHDLSRKNPFVRKVKDFGRVKIEKIGSKRNASFSIGLDRAANSIPKSALLGVGLLSGFGVAALAAYGATQKSGEVVTEGGTTSLYGIRIENAPQVARGTYSQELRRKIGSAYGYFAGSLALTAVSAAALYKSPLAFRIHQSPWLFIGVGVVGTIAAMIGTQMIPYNQSPFLKHAAWLTFTGLEGLTMAPLAVLGGPLLMNAAIATGCIVGSISLLTAVAPSDAWRQYSGVFGIGLGLLMGASIGMAFFPSPILYNLVLYGGLALHGWGVFRETGRIIEHSNKIPIQRFDPINESIGLYVHTLGIFIRMVMMMGNNRRK